MNRINSLVQKPTFPMKGLKPLLAGLGLLLLGAGTARPQSIIYSNFTPSNGTGYSASYFSMQDGNSILVDGNWYAGVSVVVPFTVPAGQNYRLSKIEVVASLPWIGLSGYPIHAYVLTDPAALTWPYPPPHTSIDYTSTNFVTLTPRIIVFDASKNPVTLQASTTYYLKLVGTEVTNIDTGPLQVNQNSAGISGPSQVLYTAPGNPSGLFPTNTLYPVFRISGTAVVPTGITCTGGSVIYDSTTSPRYTPAGCLFPSGLTPSNIASCNKQLLTMFLPTNSGTCLVCVQAQYVALVNAGSATSTDPLGPASYLYRPGQWNDIQHLTLDPDAVDFPGGVEKQMPFRCLQCTNPPPGLAAWWTFDELPWEPVANAIPGLPDGIYHGTNSGFSYPVPGQVGWAKQFDGISDYIEVPSAAAYDVGSIYSPPPSSACTGRRIGCPGDFSIDAWVKIDVQDAAWIPSSGVRVIVEKRDYSQGLTGYSFYLYNGYLGLQMASGGGFANFGAPALKVPADGQWHLVAVSVRRRGAEVHFFMDGTDVQANTSSGVPAGSLANLSPLRIGVGTLNNGSDAFKGSIDEVEFFQNFVNAADFTKIFNAKCYGKCK
jgi:hypothetical protein